MTGHIVNNVTAAALQQIRRCGHVGVALITKWVPYRRSSVKMRSYILCKSIRSDFRERLVMWWA